MKNGAVLDFDALVLAVGVRANTSLVKAIGGEVNRGIIVDERMKTSVANVYAAGDCAEGTDCSTGQKTSSRNSAKRLHAGILPVSIWRVATKYLIEQFL